MARRRGGGMARKHPSGVAEPSNSDRAITHRLIDVRVLDRLVIGDAEAVSFAERGLL